jgi:hypothetical protein
MPEITIKTDGTNDKTTITFETQDGRNIDVTEGVLCVALDATAPVLMLMRMRVTPEGAIIVDENLVPKTEDVPLLQHAMQVEAQTYKIDRGQPAVVEIIPEDLTEHGYTVLTASYREACTKSEKPDTIVCPLCRQSGPNLEINPNEGDFCRVCGRRIGDTPAIETITEEEEPCETLSKS